MGETDAIYYDVVYIFASQLDFDFEATMFMPTSQLANLYSPLDIPDSGKQPFTDYSRWRLLVDDGGRQTWHYLRSDEECEKWPQNEVDKYWTGQPLVSARPSLRVAH
jgi:hypothetical protein